MVVTKPDRDPEQSEVKDGDDEETRRSGRMSQGPGLPGLTGIAGYPAMPYQPPSRPAGRNRGPGKPQRPRDIRQLLGQCWASVVDGGSTLIQ